MAASAPPEPTPRLVARPGNVETIDEGIQDDRGRPVEAGHRLKDPTCPDCRRHGTSIEGVLVCPQLSWTSELWSRGVTLASKGKPGDFVACGQDRAFDRRLDAWSRANADVSPIPPGPVPPRPPVPPGPPEPR